MTTYYPSSAPFGTSHPYADNTDDSWIYTDAGADGIAFWFDDNTALGAGDVLYIYDSTNTLRYTLTGFMPLDRRVWGLAGDTVTFRLVSDGSGTNYGFEVSRIYAFTPRSDILDEDGNPAPPSVIDTFSRSVGAGSWGTTDTGWEWWEDDSSSLPGLSVNGSAGVVAPVSDASFANNILNNGPDDTNGYWLLDCVFRGECSLSNLPPFRIAEGFDPIVESFAFEIGVTNAFGDRFTGRIYIRSDGTYAYEYPDAAVSGDVPESVAELGTYSGGIIAIQGSVAYREPDISVADLDLWIWSGGGTAPSTPTWSQTNSYYQRALSRPRVTTEYNRPFFNSGEAAPTAYFDNIYVWEYPHTAIAPITSPANFAWII